MNNKVVERINEKLKRYQRIIAKQLENDINESDTVTVITDILCELFGFDKYDNITSEFAIRKTFCDLAIKINDKLALLIECKAVGINLKDDHVRQATNYAAEQGVNWVVLTNGKTWRVYKIIFSQPIDKQLVYEFDLLDLSLKKQETMEMLYPLCREAFTNGIPEGLNQLYGKKQVVNKYVFGQLLVSDEIVSTIKRKFKRLFPDVKIDNEIIINLLQTEIIKRDVFDSEQIKEYIKTIKKAEKKLEKQIIQKKQQDT